MIEPERVLYYFENVALWLAESEPEKPEDEWSAAYLRGVRSLMQNFYQFCHVGTSALRTCQHPDWEEEFLKAEAAIVESGWMKPWEQKIQGVKQ